MGKKGAVPAAPAEAAAETFDMVFHVQLAHGSPTKQVRTLFNY
jgi:PDZ domain-containing protein GIPC